MPGLKLSIDASQLDNAKRTATSAFSSIGRQAKQTETKIGAVQRGLSSMNNKLRSMVRGLGSWQSALGAAAGAAGLGYMVNRTLEANRQIEKLSRTTGFSIEAIQELQFVAQKSGVSSARLSDALGELTQRMGEAAADGGEMAEGFKQAGIEIDGLASRRPQKVLYQIADAIQEADTHAKAAAISVKTFGDEMGREMLTVLRNGSGQIKNLANRAQELGLVLSEDVVRGSAKAKEKIDVLVKVLGKNFQRIVGTLAPKISEVASSMVDWVEANQRFIKQKIPSHVEGLFTKLTYVLDVIEGVGRAFKVTGSAIALGVVEAQRQFWELADTIVNGPIRALNQMIDLYNKIPALPNLGVKLGDFSYITKGLKQAERAVAAGKQNIDEILMEPFPGREMRKSFQNSMEKTTQATKQNSKATQQNSRENNKNTRATQRNADSKNEQASAYQKVIDRLNEQIKKQRMSRAEYRKQKLIEEAEVDRYGVKAQKIRELVEENQELQNTQSDKKLDSIASSSDNVSNSMDKAKDSTQRMNQELNRTARNYEKTARSAGKLSQAARSAGASNVGGGDGTESALTREGGPLSGNSVPLYPLTLRDQMQIPFWERSGYGGDGNGSFFSQTNKEDESPTSTTPTSGSAAAGADMPTIQVEQNNYGVNDPFEIAARIEDELIKRMKTGKMREAIQEVSAGRS